MNENLAKKAIEETSQEFGNDLVLFIKADVSRYDEFKSKYNIVTFLNSISSSVLRKTKLVSPYKFSESILKFLSSILTSKVYLHLFHKAPFHNDIYS